MVRTRAQLLSQLSYACFDGQVNSAEAAETAENAETIVLM